MWSIVQSKLLAAAVLSAIMPAVAAAAVGVDDVVEKPEAIVADGLPPIPESLADEVRPYLSSRSALSATWNPADRSLLISTRFANTPQLHTVASPLAMRRQISFEAETVRYASYAPKSGDVLLVMKDVGGNEAFQIYSLKDGRLSLLTDGEHRNSLEAWSRDGKLIGYSSVRRNGTDWDLYVMDPRDPSTDRMVMQGQGVWQIEDFFPDGGRAVVSNPASITKSTLYELDLETGERRAITDPAAETRYDDAQFGPDGRLWAMSDKDSDFRRLGTLDLASGRFVPLDNEPKWDVEAFEVAEDGRFVAYTLNEAGISRLKVHDLSSGTTRTANDLPIGLIADLDVAPWGEIAVTLISAQSPLDAFSVNPDTLAVTRWTQGETGGLDSEAFVTPELIEVESFDGEAVSGFLYRPDSSKFPGKRPLIIDIHGGPEAQARPMFQYGKNYLINELGIAIFYPNVRGSTGYGKRFGSLDNGPFKREDSVKDIGAFIDALAKDPGLDADRFGVTGGSYGGYMCYAAAIHHGDRLRAAIAEVAVSNIVTVLESMESYRRDLRRPEYGDERDPAQRAKLLEISPLTRANEITIPLMVVTGVNDPRVPPSEAHQMVDAVRANGRDVWHLIAENEGHGFYRKENQDYHFLATVLFWKKHLLGEGLEQASGKVPPRRSTGEEENQ
jgi:dipeptidyl aminopeptidase/acylaminoacyl peptidase